ncbi:MAG: hypothetical protein QM639_03420 [Rhodocyclaceae bacterium]
MNGHSLGAETIAGAPSVRMARGDDEKMRPSRQREEGKSPKQKGRNPRGFGLSESCVVVMGGIEPPTCGL